MPLRRFGLFETVDDDRARKRDLGVGELKQLLPNDFPGKKALGLIGQVVGRIPRLALRHAFDDGALQAIHIVARRRRQRDDLREVRQTLAAIDDRQQLRPS